MLKYSRMVEKLGQTVNAAAQEDTGGISMTHSRPAIENTVDESSGPAAAAPSQWIDDGAKLRELRYAFESVVAYAQKNDLTMRPDFDYLLALLDCAINAFLPFAAPSQPNLTAKADG